MPQTLTPDPWWRREGQEACTEGDGQNSPALRARGVTRAGLGAGAEEEAEGEGTREGRPLWWGGLLAASVSPPVQGVWFFLEMLLEGPCVCVCVDGGSTPNLTEDMRYPSSVGETGQQVQRGKLASSLLGWW